MSKRSVSRGAAVLLTGAAMAIAADTAVAQAPPGQAGLPAESVAPAIDPAGAQAPTGVTPRVRGFKGCAGGGVCIFRGADYSIWKARFGDAYAGAWRWILITDGVARRHYSAKNRFANRRLVLRGTRANGTWARFCLNPGGSRPGPIGPGMLQFYIGAPGSRC